MTLQAMRGHGMIGFSTTMERARGLGAESGFRHRYPHYEFWGLAAGLHSHWWVERGVRGRDAVLPAAFGTAYGISAIEAVYGMAPADRWMERMRECAEPKDGRIGPLTARSRESWCTASFLVSRTLPVQVGGAVVLESVDRIMRREHPPSFEGLAAALEAVSGQPMQDFFDVWVHTGLAPEIEVEWSFEDGVVRGRAWSGIPFGAVEIPVRIEGGDQRVEHMLRIENGQSEFELVWPHPTAPAQLRVDPTNALLLKRGSGRVFVPTRDSAQGEVG